MIGYSTRYLFLDIDKASSETIIFLEISFESNCLNFFFLNISCLIFDSTKTIGLLALDFYEMIVDSGIALINYHLRNLELLIQLLNRSTRESLRETRNCVETRHRNNRYLFDFYGTRARSGIVSTQFRVSCKPSKVFL